MRTKILFTFLLSVITITQVFSQTGVKGVIKDKVTGETLIGANIIVENVENKGASAGLDGDFSITLNPGKYNITASFVGYVPKTLEVTVVQGKMTEIVFAMDQISIEFKDFVVEETAITTTENATVAEQKNNDATVNVMGEKEIAKSGTLRTASDVAGRIPGVTIIDNRFVMVRGLSERYNAVMINNAFTPSLETDVKTFSFDIIPSQAIERFMIYKSQSPDLPGEFSGGAIKVYTKGIPERSEIVGSYSISYRNGTTFQPFQISKSSKTDWLGFDNGMRALPDGTPSNIKTITNPQQLQTLGQSFNSDWSYQTKNAAPDQRFNFGYNGLWKNKDKSVQFGNVSLLTYTYSNQHFISNRYDYNVYNMASHTSDSIVSYHDTVNQTQARLGYLQNFGLKFGHNTIDFKNTFNQIGMNETTLRGGVNYEEGTNRKEYAYRYNQRTFYMGQLNGDHKFGQEKGNDFLNHFDWTASYSLSRRQDPDWRRVRYTNQLGSNDPYSAYIPFSAQPFYMGRLFVNMNEDIKMAAANYERRFVFYNKDSVMRYFQPRIKAGFYVEDKFREFSIRNIGYKPASIFNFDWSTIPFLPVDSLFLPQNINSSTGLQISEDTKGPDSYKASNKLRAYYLMANLPFHERFKINGGIRIEDNDQQLHSKKLTGDTLIIDNHIISYLPSFNAAFYLIPDTMQIRVAYGKSVNRPEFREIAPFAFYDFIFNSIYQGVDSLKTPTINNFDVRWEYYPRIGEVISVGGFYKKFTNPIELYYTPGGGSGGTRSFVYGNAPGAVSYGAELELRKSLKDVVRNKFLSDITLVFNGAYIKSEITLAKGDTSASATRPMMGQSPYIVNGGIYYQNDSIGLSVAVLYNRIGPRVIIVGIPSIPEVYEMPRNRLDITVTKELNKNLSLRISAQDLLNNKYILLQDGNEDGKLQKKNDQIMRSYQLGSYFTVGVNWNVGLGKENKKTPVE